MEVIEEVQEETQEQPEQPQEQSEQPQEELPKQQNGEEKIENVINITTENIESLLSSISTISKEEIEDLFNKNTASFRCLAQTLMSSSSLLRHPLYHFPPPVDPGIDEAFDYIQKPPEYDDIGIEKYLDVCKEFNIVPIRRIIKSLPEDTLDLKYYGLTVPQIKALMGALSINLHVKTLILQDNWLPVESSEYVGNMLKDNTVLRVLNMRECRIGPKGAELISEGIGAMLTLVELDLSYNSLGDEGIEYLHYGLLESPVLKKLNLSHNNLGNGSCKFLASFFQKSNTILDVNLSWNNFYTNPGFKLIMKSLQTNTSICTLNMAWNGISTSDCTRWMARFMIKCPSLQYLDLSNNRLTGPALSQIRRGILKSKSLIEVKLDNNPIQPREVISLATTFTSKPPDNTLKRINLEHVWANKNFLPVKSRIEAIAKTFEIEGVYSDYIIQGPDQRKLMFARAKFLAMNQKKKKKRKDFGHFVLQLPDDIILEEIFLKLVKKFKMKKVDKDLVAGIMNEFRVKKKVNCVELKESYLSYYPDTTLPKKKKKGKKGKKKRKKKGAKSDETETTTATTTEVSTTEDGKVEEKGPPPPPEGKVGDETATKAPEGEETATKAPEGDETAAKAPVGDETTTKAPENDETATKPDENTETAPQAPEGENAQQVG